MEIKKTVTINKPDGPSITTIVAVDGTPDDHEWADALEAACMIGSTS